ncbi:phosphotransferase [Vibrio viridaestus]|uniref:Thiamine kinase n=1 Tax=Vibrio viridaestus TaxID=2487322 RepID=A0A3N9U5C4_9VIBR|nr:phosphotransferase [Vibrio viridaestus]RQW63246.1 thiamine kinase [Vibrio viridaestus]
MAKIPWDEACEFDPTLLALGRVFDVIPPNVETLTGGLTNRCWKVHTHDGQEFIWRPVTSLTRKLAISRQQEYLILGALQKNACYFSPKPISRQPEGILVEWLSGEPVKTVQEMDLVRLLHDIHHQDLFHSPVSQFNYTARVDHYWLTLESNNIDLSRYKDLYNKLRVAPSVIALKPTLCHLDLGKHNLIRNQKGLCAIDWEYSTLADPRLDLAMTLSMEDFDVVSFVARYCQLAGYINIDNWIDGVQAWMPRVNLMALLWYLVAYHHGCGEEYLSSAEEIFNRLQE